MPTPSLPTPQRSGPTWILPELVSVLSAELSLDPVRIKTVDMATFKGKITESAQERTILLAVGDMTQLNPGGGRSALVTRPLLVQVVTVSYKDPGGRNEEGLQAHWLFEDSVAEALLLYRPLTNQTGYPITLGNLSPVNFDLPVDPGRYRSAFQLNLTYQLNITCSAP